jgi:hypothetical protein
MMSLATIRSLSDEAGRKARRSRKLPWHPETIEDISVENLRQIPNLGTYTPSTWTRTEKDFFADASGFGAENEPALTPNRLVKAMRDHFACNPTAGYAITEVGQFQLYITAFKKAERPTCYRCNRKIRDAEYLSEPEGARHMCCPPQGN